jgi:hypothetical protein
MIYSIEWSRRSRRRMVRVPGDGGFWHMLAGSLRAGRGGNVGFAPIVLKKSALLAESQHWVRASAVPSSGRRLRDRDQLGELAEVLGGGGEEELVLGTIRAPQAQAVQLQDTLEVGEQHLDLLPLAA